MSSTGREGWVVTVVGKSSHWSETFSDARLAEHFAQSYRAAGFIVVMVDAVLAAHLAEELLA